MTEKTVAEKLLIKPGTTAWVSDPKHVPLLQPLPRDVRFVQRMDGAGTAVIFAESEDSLRELLKNERDGLTTAGTLWVAYPKANRADINRDTLWPILGEYGLRPITQVAVDDVWSALRFRPLKPGEEQLAQRGREGAA